MSSKKIIRKLVRFSCLFCIVGAVGLSSCNKTPDSSLRCIGSQGGATCLLRQGMSYSGICLGMTQVDVYQHICAGVESNDFYDLVATPSVATVRGDTVRSLGFRGRNFCRNSQWPSKYVSWMFRSHKGICPLTSEEMVDLQFRDGRLRELRTTCTTILS